MSADTQVENKLRSSIMIRHRCLRIPATEAVANALFYLMPDDPEDLLRDMEASQLFNGFRNVGCSARILILLEKQLIGHVKPNPSLGLKGSVWFK